MGIVSGIVGAPPQNSLYRITLTSQQWQLVRPHASVAHAFENLDDALAFVRSDSDGAATAVEILAGTFYMVKSLAS